MLAGHDSWGAMALAAGRLIVRDLTRMECLDVNEESKLLPPKVSAAASTWHARDAPDKAYC